MIAILADDLTSALDGAAPFAARGLSAQVLLHQHALAACNSDVVAIDLDSRCVAAAEAESRFLSAAKQVHAAAILCKTIDSTLRGNLAAETRGCLAGSRRPYAVIAPAFPAAGRTTVGGCQLVDGVPLEHTAFASDPRTPVVSGVVAQQLAGLDRALFSIHDASHDRALDELVLSTGLTANVLWVGSPGLCAALARACIHRPDALRAAGLSCKRILVVIGSLHPANQPQLDELAHAGAALIQISHVTSGLDTQSVAAEVSNAFANSPLVCLLSPRSACAGGSEVAGYLAHRIGEVVQQCAPHFDGLIATGGDTARRIADALNADTLDLLGEVEPGVAYGILRVPGRAMPFAAKAGGFGNARTLLRCVDRLRTACDGES